MRPSRAAGGRGAETRARPPRASRATHPDGDRRHVHQHHPDHRRACRAFTSGEYANFALFSCFIDGSPGAAIVAVNRYPPAEKGEEPEFMVRPLFVSVTPTMTISDHDGSAA